MLPSLKLTAKAPENGWLEYYFPIPIGYGSYGIGVPAYFQVRLLLVSGRVVFRPKFQGTNLLFFLEGTSS